MKVSSMDTILANTRAALPRSNRKRKRFYPLGRKRLKSPAVVLGKHQARYGTAVQERRWR